MAILVRKLDAPERSPGTLTGHFIPGALQQFTPLLFGQIPPLVFFIQSINTAVALVLAQFVTSQCAVTFALLLLLPSPFLAPQADSL